MTTKQRETIFHGGFICMALQFTMISLILLEFMNEKKLQINKNFMILIPRLIASFFMHTQLEPVYRKGIQVMKYVVNHP